MSRASALMVVGLDEIGPHYADTLKVWRERFFASLPAVRALGFDLGFRRGLLRAPPPETIFLHRKLVGSFLQLARIGARVDARALVLPFLFAEGRAGKRAEEATSRNSGSD